MESPTPLPPGYTSYIDSKEYEYLFDRLDRAGNIYTKMGDTHVAPSVEDAEEDMRRAQEEYEDMKGELEYKKNQAETLGVNLDVPIKRMEAKLPALQVKALLMEIRYITTQREKLKEKPERSTGKLEPRVRGQSSIFPNLKGVGRRLKTRRAKKRNGSAAILRNRTGRMSRRKV
jgi:hypothetical protein